MKIYGENYDIFGNNEDNTLMMVPHDTTSKPTITLYPCTDDPAPLTIFDLISTVIDDEFEFRAVELEIGGEKTTYTNLPIVKFKKDINKNTLDVGVYTGDEKIYAGIGFTDKIIKYEL